MHLGLGNSQKAKRFRKFVTRSSTKFDGTDDVITTSADSTLASKTYSFWAKTSDTNKNAVWGHGADYGSSGGGAFLFNWNTGSNKGPILWIGGGRYILWQDDICPEQDDGLWHHWLVYLDTTTVTDCRLFCDGVEKTTVNATAGGSGGTYASGIQLGFTSGSDYFNGSLDEFAIFDGDQSALADELYNNGQPTKIRTTPNLDHWFRMGEGKLGSKSDGDSNILFQGLPTTFGSELVTNGDFSSASGWTADSNAAITGGKLVLTGSSGLSYQTIDLDNGAAYEVTFTIENFSSGTVKPYLNGTNGTVRSANGTYTEVIIAGSSNTLVGINPSGTMDIDNFSVKKLTNVGTISGAAIQADGGTELVTNGTFDTDSNWTKGTGWTISGGSASRTAQSGSTACDQDITFTVGSVYAVTYDLTVSAGSLQTRLAGGTNVNGAARTVSGSYTDYLTAVSGNNKFRLVAIDAAFAGSVDNVSVKEVTESVPKKTQNLPSAGSAKSMDFDGTDDVVEVSTLNTLSGASKFTLSGWFNKADAGHKLAISYDNSGSNRTSINFHTDSKVYFNLAAGGANYGEFALASTDWVHLAMVYDGSASGNANRLKGYLDGVEQTLTFNSTIPATAHSQSAVFRIGKDQANSAFSQGAIDEVAIWNEALDGDAIKALYNAGEPTPVITKTGAYDIYRDNLQAYYKMGDASDPAADGTNNLLFDQTSPGEVEMITNGDFSNGTTDWTTIGGGALSVVNGKLRVTSSSSYRYAYQLMTTRVGGVYSVTLEATKGTSPNYDSFVGTGTGAGNLVYLGAGGGSDSQGDTTTQSGIFTATTTTSYLMLRSRNESSVADAFTDFDNVSVKEYNGNTGTITGATIQTEAPKQIYALPPVANTKSINFDGTNDHLVTQVDSTAQPNNESRYYSFWCKASDTGVTARQAIFSHGGATVGAFYLNFSSSRPLLYMASAVYQFWADTPTGAQDDGNWHHWVVKIKYNDITGCELWCDAVRQTKSDVLNSGSMNTYSSGITLGAEPAGSRYLEGSIDEFSIHEDLDDEAIRALFNRGRPIEISRNHGAYDTYSDKLLHWWRMGDAPGGQIGHSGDVLFQGLQAESDELVTNGDFSNGNTGWTEVGDFAVSGGSASITSASQYSQLTCQEGTNFLVAGRTYKLEADITSSINNALAYRVSGGVVTPISTSEIADGKYTAHFTMIQNGHFWFQTTGSYTGLNATVDNVSVKQVRGQYIGPELVKADADLYQASTWTSYGGNDETFPSGTAARFDRPSSGGDTRGGYVSLNSSEALTSNLETGCVYKLQFDFLTDDSDAFPRYYDGSSYTNLSAGSGLKVHYFAFSGSGFINVDGLTNDKFVQFSGLTLTKIGGAAVMTNMTTSDIQTDTPY